MLNIQVYIVTGGNNYGNGGMISSTEMLVHGSTQWTEETSAELPMHISGLASVSLNNKVLIMGNSICYMVYDIVLTFLQEEWQMKLTLSIICLISTSLTLLPSNGDRLVKCQDQELFTKQVWTGCIISKIEYSVFLKDQSSKNISLSLPLPLCVFIISLHYKRHCSIIKIRTSIFYIRENQNKCQLWIKTHNYDSKIILSMSVVSGLTKWW